MIFLLNHAWIIIFFLTLLAVYKARRKPKLASWITFAGIVAILTLAAITPSYMPKGVVQRVEVEQFETVEVEMQDKLLKPDTSSEFRKERIEARKEYNEKVQN